MTSVVTAYQTTDGALFIDKKAADRHEHLITFEKAYYSSMHKDIQHIDNPTTMMSFLVKHKDTIKTVLGAENA